MPGLQEWLVIAVVALLVFGPDRLPELARNAGRLLSKVRSETARNVEELKRVSEIQELQAELRGLKRDLRGFGGQVDRQVRDATRLTEPSAGGAAATGERGGPTGDPEGPVPPTDPEAT